jgi:hypothetical protein
MGFGDDYYEQAGKTYETILLGTGRSIIFFFF